MGGSNFLHSVAILVYELGCPECLDNEEHHPMKGFMICEHMKNIVGTLVRLDECLILAK